MNMHNLTPENPSRSLDQLPGAASARIDRIAGDRTMQQRLQMLGIRPGVALQIVHGPNKRGVVIQINGARFAIGNSMVQKIWVTELSA
ncbi:MULTISPECIES: FeoA family protein [unclassified Acidithiobacillus]|uniref:FeoA family protein n=1 Tax=unclassified Acidithiobacillus TaxID=2614800 RepID=UPI001D0D1D2A|nr:MULTISPECIES: FeoA family protein [unclassified Acidithiobacillus]